MTQTQHTTSTKSRKAKAMGLLTIPVEVLDEITGYLSYSSRFALSLTCRALHTWIDNPYCTSKKRDKLLSERLSQSRCPVIKPKDLFEIEMWPAYLKQDNVQMAHGYFACGDVVYDLAGFPLERPSTLEELKSMDLASFARDAADTKDMRIIIGTDLTLAVHACPCMECQPGTTRSLNNILIDISVSASISISISIFAFLYLYRHVTHLVIDQKTASSQRRREEEAKKQRSKEEKKRRRGDKEKTKDDGWGCESKGDRVPPALPSSRVLP
ncbi:hypothetical protein TRV_01106 [Trichophyton verrucosum HKI 0517]|uniref:F-box domain-containing protein n=1 Tax=Trichophyton verrucosum (strain HKI 0517) TaxID=663202 RepID=D4D204_TRIVH|nr:uncharacterized protein TRV_01106 [Trichophyton verrucosum HKI 0517]EFE44146.1 hypothetical protein TRV_01106 [Trichophyton verrucosum HKI 0517]